MQPHRNGLLGQAQLPAGGTESARLRDRQQHFQCRQLEHAALSGMRVITRKICENQCGAGA